MANEKRLIDANELTNRLNHTTMVAYPNLFPGLHAAVEIVDDSPTVDAVEVVRCKDCNEWEYDEDFSGWCGEWRRRTHCNHFCSYGERKDSHGAGD